MAKSSLKLVIFDLDGTLVDAYGAVRDSLNAAFVKLRLPTIDLQTVKNSVGWGEKKLIRKFVPADLAARALKLYQRHHVEILKSEVKFLPA